ncbi:TRAP transporter substrate-binding protein [Solibacillus sp. FSL W8-0474]|uniref:TRAP transporter substrate-binding protein n=1 Tax=Solibacillus sp. FSL W8-0474 TaxID=2975336 RepID=UPI0030FA1F10
MRKLKIAALFTLIATILVGCSTSAEEGTTGSDKIKLKVAHYYSETHPQHIALKEKFEKVVEEKTNGAIDVEIYPSAQLGDEEQYTNGVRNGTIEMSISGMGLQNAEPKIGAMELPFIFEDYEHAQAAFDGDVGTFLADAFSQFGVETLAITANGFRVISSNKEISSMNDLKGLRLRLPNMDTYLQFGNAIGVSVQPMGLSEIFTALEQKVIDGQENPYATLKESGFYEVQSHVLESNHMFSPNVILINQKFIDNLPEDQQTIIRDAAKDAAAYEWEMLINSVDETKQFLIENGIKIQVPSESFKADLLKSVQTIHDKIINSTDWGQEFLELVDKYK